MVEATQEIEFTGEPVFCNTCGTMYDSKEGKSQPHKIIDAFLTPKKTLKKISLKNILRFKRK